MCGIVGYVGDKDAVGLIVEPEIVGCSVTRPVLLIQMGFETVPDRRNIRGGPGKEGLARGVKREPHPKADGNRQSQNEEKAGSGRNDRSRHRPSQGHMRAGTRIVVADYSAPMDAMKPLSLDTVGGRRVASG